MHLSALLWRLFKILGIVAWLAMGLSSAQVLAEDLDSSVNVCTIKATEGSEDSSPVEQQGYLGTRSLFYINNNIENSEARSLHYFEGGISRKANGSDQNFGMDLEGQFVSSQAGFHSFSIN